MFVHCQFTIGQAPQDPMPLVVMGIVGPEDVLHGEIVALIKSLVMANLGGEELPNAITPSSSIGFHRGGGE